jgi:hypothetical protein
MLWAFSGTCFEHAKLIRPMNILENWNVYGLFCFVPVKGMQENGILHTIIKEELVDFKETF